MSFCPYAHIVAAWNETGKVAGARTEIGSAI